MKGFNVGRSIEGGRVNNGQEPPIARTRGRIAWVDSRTSAPRIANASQPIPDDHPHPLRDSNIVRTPVTFVTYPPQGQDPVQAELNRIRAEREAARLRELESQQRIRHAEEQARLESARITEATQNRLDRFQGIMNRAGNPGTRLFRLQSGNLEQGWVLYNTYTMGHSGSGSYDLGSTPSTETFFAMMKNGDLYWYSGSAQGRRGGVSGVEHYWSEYYRESNSGIKPGIERAYILATSGKCRVGDLPEELFPRKSRIEVFKEDIPMRIAEILADNGLNWR